MIELAEGLFTAESVIRFYGVRLQTRMAVVRIGEGRLLLYSPVFPTPTLRQELARLGEVAFVVSPNKIHHQAWSACEEAFPNALFFVPPGLPERRPGLRCDAILGEEAPAAWRGALDLVLTAGNVFFREAVLFHHGSATLLVGDLVENFDAHTTSRVGLALAGLFGVPERPVASPEFRLYTDDADAAAAALARIRAWPFRRIFLCHGALIERDAQEVFAAVCGELLETVRQRGRLSRWVLRHTAGLQ